MRVLKLGSALICLFFLKIAASENRAEATCSDGNLPCDDGDCLRREDWCDGTSNCEDRSDEAYCKTKSWYKSDPNGCKDTHFLCSDGRCVPKVANCDGHSDCKDGSDEKHCKSDEDYDEEYTYSEKPVNIFTDSTTTQAVSDGHVFKEDIATPTQAFSREPTSASTPGAPLHSLISKTDSQYHSPINTEPSPAPERYNGQDVRQSTAASRLLPPATSPTRSYDSRLYDTPQTSTAQPTRAYDSRQHPGESHDLRRDPNQQYTRSTRSYVPRQDPNDYTSQPTRPYDPRRYSYPTHPIRPDPRRDPYTQPTRPYDPRRDPYQTQPTRPDPRRDPYTRPTRPYDPRRDPYQTQPTRPYDPRRDPYTQTTRPYDPRRYPYRTQPTRPYDPSIHNAVTHRIYLNQGDYFGYYDETGRFVVLYSDNGIRQEPPGRGIPEPEPPTSSPVVFNRRLKVPSRFYFPRNYTRIQENNHLYLRKGKQWILSVRNSSGGWGIETPRALVALSLLNNSFVNGPYENDIMQKYFQVFLGTSILRGDAKMTTLNRLAMSINALLATCHNPRDFHGTDLTELVRRQMSRKNGERTRTNPAVYLSLCLADRDFTRYEERDLLNRMTDHSTRDEYERDMLSLSVMAFSCHMRRQKSRDSEDYRYLQTLMSKATIRLLDRVRDDGSFGSVYSTALAAQALLSVNDTKNWNAESTFDFLLRHQKDNGSFGDFLATYLALPALSGRSLLHLRNTQCTPPKIDRDLTPSEILEFRGPKQHVRYSLYIGYPMLNGYSVELFVPHGISFFDIMRVAQHQKNAFKFLYEEKDGGIYVYSISNIPNDSEKGLGWNLYAKKNSDTEPNKVNNQERITGDIREFYPSSDQHVIFWYHPSDIRSL